MSERMIREIQISEIDEPADQVRSYIGSDELTELARSIEKVGVLQPIIVTQKNARYEIVAGHRRFLANLLARKATIPCIIMDPLEVDETEAKIHENLFREDINPADEAQFYQKILDLKTDEPDQEF